MTAFKRGGRATYFIGPKRFAGGVELRRVSTGTKDKRLADAMESALYELAGSGWGDLIARVGEDIRLPDLYAAKLEGPRALARLRDQQNDPLLSDVLERAPGHISDPRGRHGIEQLRAYIAEKGPRERLSWLADPKQLNRLYAEALASDRAPNSVRRSLHRAVSMILAHELGRSKMLGIMAEVKKPGTKDERDVDLTPKQIETLLRACDEELKPMVELALLTGIDMTPLLRLRPMDYDEALGCVQVDDRKTPSRKRSVPVSHAAAVILRRLSKGLDESEPLIGLSRWAVRGRFDTAKKYAGLKHVRFKDLRGVFATNYLKAGGSPKDLQAILGHSDLTMTLRYVRRSNPSQRQTDMEGAAERMGLGRRAMLKIERGGA